jgi:hypothetical protein
VHKSFWVFSCRVKILAEVSSLCVHLEIYVHPEKKSTKKTPKSIRKRAKMGRQTAEKKQFSSGFFHAKEFQNIFVIFVIQRFFFCAFAFSLFICAF